MALVATLRSSLRPGAVLLAAALAAGACGDSADSTPAPSPTGEVDVERVVSLVPTLTEIVIDLGGAERLVGIGKYDPDVPGHPDVPRLSDAFSVSLEAVTALEPDVVLVNGVALAEHLAPLSGRIRVETLPTDRLADVEHAVERVGELLGRPLAARSLQDRLSAAMTAARERARTREGDAPSVLVVVQRRPLYVAGGGSFLHELLEAVGATNAAGDLADAWPVLSDESVVARSPDVVLDASAGTSDPGTDAEPITGLPASRVVRLGEDSEPLFRAGPQLPAALRLLERLLYEETR